MGLFAAKHDNTDVHAQDPDPVPDSEYEDPEGDGNDITLRVTFHDGRVNTFQCDSYVTPDNDEDASNIVLTKADDKQIWLNERYVVSMEEL